MTSGHDTPPRPVRAACGRLAALVGVLLVLAAVVVGAVPAAAQNRVGASTPAVANTVGSSTDIGAGQRLGKVPPQPQIVVATAVAADTAVDSGGGLVSRLRGMDWADDTGSIRIPGSSGRLTNSQAAQMADRVGYRPTNYISRGEKVFTNGKTFITQDATSHTGGLWKMANSVQDLRAGTRLGTYDYDLNWIAP